MTIEFKMIRPYLKKDKEQVVELLRLNIPRFFDHSEERDFIEYLDKEIEDYFVVEERSKIIGAGGINYFPDEKASRIAWDMIHPHFQGKGIGQKLTQYRINHIRENTLMEAVVVRTSQLAHEFYHKMGFRLENTKKDYWAKGFDLYLMKLKLERTDTI